MQPTSNRAIPAAETQKPAPFRQLEGAEWVAETLRISESTLAKWRSAGIGPQFYKMSGRVVYDRADIECYLDSCRIQTNAQPGKAA